MPNGIYSAMTGALAQEEHMDIVANNLANGSTNGFKSVQATFKELLDETREGTKNQRNPHGEPWLCHAGCITCAMLDHMQLN